MFDVAGPLGKLGYVTPTWLPGALPTCSATGGPWGHGHRGSAQQMWRLCQLRWQMHMQLAAQQPGSNATSFSTCFFSRKSSDIFHEVVSNHLHFTGHLKGWTYFFGLPTATKVLFLPLRAPSLASAIGQEMDELSTQGRASLLFLRRLCCIAARRRMAFLGPFLDRGVLPSRCGTKNGLV